jgi:competence protein ComEA
MTPVAMDERKRRISSPLAAGGAILAVLALVGLARGYDQLDAEPRPAAPPPLAPIDAGPPPDAGLSSAQIQRLLEEEPMDVNRATAAELELLPRIGPTLAGRIVEERERGGPFASVQDLQRVRGIGPATVARLDSLATVERADAGAGGGARDAGP